MKRKRWFFDPFKSGNIWGFERSTLYVSDEMYMDRYILYVSGFTARLHKFYRGDDERAFHCHPWAFLTFPFATYEEDVPNAYWTRVRKTVKGLRFHFRPATYRHIVKGRANGQPFWTFVVTGRRSRTWGFWPRPDKFVDWRLW